MWSQGNLLENPFSELLAFIVQQAEPEGQSLDLQKSTPSSWNGRRRQFM